MLCRSARTVTSWRTPACLPHGLPFRRFPVQRSFTDFNSILDDYIVIFHGCNVAYDRYIVIIHGCNVIHDSYIVIFHGCSVIPKTYIIVLESCNVVHAGYIVIFHGCSVILEQCIGIPSLDSVIFSMCGMLCYARTVKLARSAPLRDNCAGIDARHPAINLALVGEPDRATTIPLVWILLDGSLGRGILYP
jgi:hypothetical protein